jgi:hypothetical protein
MMNGVQTKEMTLIPNFTYDEETDLLAAVGHGVAFMKQLADESVGNKEYWMGRAEDFDKIFNKLNTEVRNHYYNN